MEPGIGSVLKFTKYTDLGVHEGDQLDRSVNCASKTRPLWGVVTDLDEYLVRYIQGGNKYAKAKLEREGPDKWHFEIICADYDDWELIDDPSLWPDKVAVEVARIRLLGEVESD